MSLQHPAGLQHNKGVLFAGGRPFFGVFGNPFVALLTLQEVCMFSGAQFSLYVMSDDFVDVILGAVDAMGKPEDLRIESDDISTLVVGTPPRVFEAVQTAYAEACRRGGHVVLSALFSRGCPGEPDDPICTAAGPEPSELPEPGVVPPSGIEVNAQFSLYPLGYPGYMEVIGREIQALKAGTLFDRSKHFCTRLSGDLAHVFAAVYRAFESAARDSAHVVIHLTVSKGSPSN